VKPAGFDPLRALRTLTRRRVRFVVIGGIAGRLHGSSAVTNDLDICYARDPENLERLAAALVEMDARLRDTPEDLPFKPDAKTLKAGANFTFTTSAGGLDCMASPAGSRGFDELDATAVEMDLGGLVIRVAAIEDLIRLKRAAGRPKDLIEVEVLGALEEETEATPGMHGREPPQAPPRARAGRKRREA